MCWSVYGVSVHLLRSKDNFQDWVLSFHHVDLKDTIQVVEHNSTYLSLPSYQVNVLSAGITDGITTVYDLRGIIVFIG